MELARSNRDELFQALDAAKDPVYSAKSGVVRHGRIVRVAGETDAALFRDRHDPLEKVGHDLPHLLGRHRPGLGQGVIGPFANIEVAIHGAAATFGRSGPRDAEQVEVVLQTGHAGLTGRANVLLDDLDLGVSTRQSTHDAGKAMLGHKARLELERQDVHGHPVGLEPLLDRFDRRHAPATVLILDLRRTRAVDRQVLDTHLRRPG